MSSWMDRAACATVDPEIFFPVDREDRERCLPVVRGLCRVCPVREPCLEMASGEDGLWAGYTPEERRSLKRREARARSRA